MGWLREFHAAGPYRQHTYLRDVCVFGGGVFDFVVVPVVDGRKCLFPHPPPTCALFTVSALLN